MSPAARNAGTERATGDFPLFLDTGHLRGSRSPQPRPEFRRRQCPYDDGHPAERVVRQVLPGRRGVPPVVPREERLRPMPTAAEAPSPFTTVPQQPTPSPTVNDRL
ncbi:hypothetical protein AB0K80_07095 [Streptomyces sp. NPDC052682]|uniref:hypothetical protein n=1 Tax=Streptomyces sp. NPDC052682 TaxID=3154954 RepID=UPI00343AD9F8